MAEKTISTKAIDQERDAVRASKAEAQRQETLETDSEKTKAKVTSSMPTAGKGEKLYRYKSTKTDGGVGGKHFMQVGKESAKKTVQLTDGDVIAMTPKQYRSKSDRFIPV